MWILKYTYELEDGTIRRVSSCLVKQQTFSIGRSSKNPLNIKNDKSISRNHISVVWDSEVKLIRLINQGRLTAAGGKYLKVGESMDFEEKLHIREPIIIELGTKPIKVEVVWQDVVFDLPSQLSQFIDTLDHVGIGVKADTVDNRSTTIIVTDKIKFAYKCLFGLINGAVIRNSQFLVEVTNILSKPTTTFEESWDSLIQNESYMLYPNNLGAHEVILKGYKFYLIASDVITMAYVQEALERGNGELIVVENTEQLLDRLKQENSTDDLIVLKAEETTKIPGDKIKLHTLVDLVNAVSHNTVKTLLGGVPPMEAGPGDVIGSHQPTLTKTEVSSSQSLSNKEHTPEHTVTPAEKPPVKRRRYNRVKPLDSLMFFAGGDYSTEEPEQEISTQPVNPAASDTAKTSITTQINVPENDASQESSAFDKFQPNIVLKNSAKPLTIDSPGDAHNTHEINTANQHVKDIAQQIEMNHPESEQQSEQANLNMVETTPRPTARKKTLQDFKSTVNNPDNSASSTEGLVDLIKDAKSREVKRLKSTLVQVDTDELTEDAINQLGDLAIVQPNDSLIRRQKIDSAETSRNDQHPPWDGRKNFKNFVKVQAKYKEQRMGENYREGSSDFIRNSGYLLTRQYVPSKIYTKESSKEMQDFPEASEQTSRQFSVPQVIDDPEDAEPFTFTRHTSGTPANNGLFVVDEDDSQNDVVLAARESIRPEEAVQLVDPSPRRSRSLPYSPGKRKRENRRSPYDDDDDEDDDEPKFKFSRRLK